MSENLTQLDVGQSGRVVGFAESKSSSESVQLRDIDAIKQMKEMGLVNGATVTVRHIALLGKDPIAVFARGAIIGLRKIDAAKVLIERLKV